MALCVHMLGRERPYACLRASICALTSVHMPAHELSYPLPEKEPWAVGGSYFPAGDAETLSPFLIMMFKGDTFYLLAHTVFRKNCLHLLRCSSELR